MESIWLLGAKMARLKYGIFKNKKIIATLRGHKGIV
jgi:hypothetical protein